MIQYKKLMMTLALLLTVVTGAMAITDPNSVYWDNQTWSGWADSETTHTVGDITITCSGNAKAYESTTSGEPLAMEAGNNDAITFTSNGKPFASIKMQVDTDSDPGIAGWTWVGSEWTIEWSGTPSTSVTLSGCDIKADVITFTFGTAEAPITVEPVEGKTNEWTFTQPGSDVVLTPLYAPTAAWAEVESLKQLPAAAEGVIAGTDAPLIVEGIVAFAGTSTEVTQGTVMYAVTSTNQATAPALSAFSADVPTAKDIADDGADVLVWYYIKGADAPDGQQATADNTFNNSDVASLKVSVRSNKFDLALMAANANTIEAGKATVTVAGQPATVTDGKIQGVKMGSEVKMTTAQGYKFRKVEVKKGEAPATPEGPTLAQTLTTANMTVKVYYIYTDMNNTCEFLSNGDGTYTFQSGTGLVGGNSQKAKALVVENGKLVFKQNFFDPIDKLWNQVGFSVTFDTSENTYSIWKGNNETINASLSSVEVNGTQIAVTKQ